MSSVKFSLIIILCLLFSVSIYADPSDYSWSTVGDAAGMFNERGYLKSNSFSLDGNELINNFNGNLIYTQRLWHEPITVDGFNFELSISYNGSVGHLTANGFDKVGGDVQRHSINLPEWIISVNNIAIQTFNFENEEVSWRTPGSDSTAFTDDVATLITGYHSCYTWSINSEDYKYGSMSILMGDGSVKQLINNDSSTAITGEDKVMGNVFPGEYISMSKEDKSRGYVHSDGTFTLFLEDGTQVGFQMFRPKWRTAVSGINAVDSIILLLPQVIQDQIGNQIHISYSNDDPQTSDTLGRPHVLQAGAVEFDWSGGAHLTLRDWYRDDAKICTIEYGNRCNGSDMPNGVDESNRGLVNYISDIEGRKVEFGYDFYYRAGRNFTSYIKEYLNTNFGTRYMATHLSYCAKRLNKIVYPDSGISIFGYWDEDLDSVTVNFAESCNPVYSSPCIRSNEFDGLGRDPFYTNIVTSARRYLNYDSADSIIVSTDSLLFYWDDLENSNIEDGKVYNTTRWLAKDEFDDIYEQSQKHTYLYKQYWEQGPYSSTSRDRGWTHKLIEVKQYKDNFESELVKTITNDWDLGTFDLESKETTLYGITTKEYYYYSYIGDRISPLVNNLNWKAVVSPWEQVNYTYYNDDYLLVVDSTESDMYFAPGLVDSTRFGNVTSIPDSIPYYTLLLKSRSEYYDGTSSEGYIGQLSKSVNYIMNNSITTDSLITEFQYQGGNRLRKTTNPLGDSVVFVNDEVIDAQGRRFTNCVIDKQLSADGTITEAITGYSCSAPYSPITRAFLSNDDLGWEDIFAIDTINTIRISAHSIPDEDLTDETEYVLENNATLDYYLKLPDGACPGDAYTRFYINDTLVCELVCDSSRQSKSGTCSGLVNDTLKVATKGTANKSETHVWAWCDIDISANPIIDTAGTKRYDAITAYQSRDVLGNPIRAASQNKFRSEVFYDSLFRAERIILPGAFRSEGYYDSTYTNCSSVIYPSLDGTGAGFFDYTIQYCSDDSLYAFGFNYSIGDVEDANSAFLHFTDPYGDDDSGTIILDSIVLNFYSFNNPVPYNEVKIGTYAEDSYSCDDNIPTFTTLISDFTVSSGWNSYTITGEEAFTFGILSTNSNQRVYISSNDNSTNKPYLEVFYKLGPETIENETYSIRYDYTDKSIDNIPSSVQSTIRKSYNEFGQTSKAIFDGFGRAVKSLSFDSGMTTYDSIITYNDYMDRVVGNEDQLGNITETEYNILGENIKTIFPDSNATDNIYSLVGYDGVRVADLGIDTTSGPGEYLNDMPNNYLFKTTFTDENGNQLKTYKDVRGNTVLKQRFLGDTPLNTFFIYDHFGHNTLVIKPEGDHLNYRYNNLGWLIKEWSVDYDTIFYEYDKLGRVIATKHGNLFALEDDSLSYWSYNDYDAIGRVLESGLMAIDSNGVGDFDTTKSPINEFIYDQDAHENSRAKLSLAYTNDNGYEYGEEYHYDARGRLISQVNHFEPDLDSTLLDSALIRRHREEGADSTLFKIQRGGMVFYELSRCVTQDPNSFIAISLNDTLTIDSLYYTTDVYCDTISVSSIELSSGDVIKIRLNIDANDVTYATLAGKVWYERYEHQQKAFVNGHEFPIEYEYNQAGQLTKLTYPDGSIVTYDYDDRGRLLYVGDDSDQDKYALFDYTARSEVSQMILGPDAIYDSVAQLSYDLQTIDYDYNARGWLNSINAGISSSTAPDDLFGERLYYYGHADSTAWPDYYNGNIGGLVLDFQGTNTYAFSYVYDSLDRLTNACYETDAFGFLDEEFTYDKNGNILFREYGNSFLDQLTYNYTSGTNQLSDYVTGSGRFAHTCVTLHDAYGNIAFDSGRGVEYKYDIYNQLDTAKFYPEYEERLDLAFGYNTSGLRIYKDYHYTYLDSCDGGSGGGSSATGGGLEGLGTELESGGMMESGDDSLCRYYDNTKVIYIREKPGGKVIAEYDDKSDSLLFTYIYAGDKRIAMRDRTGSLHFYLTDHLGSTRIVVDSAGTVKDHYDRYYAFGDAANQTVSTDQKFRYTSKPYDDEGPFDLYYYGARYYDAKLGRFPAIDPLRGKYPEWSPYAYCVNNPLNYTDPDGRSGTAILRGATGMAAATLKFAAATAILAYIVDPNFRTAVNQTATHFARKFNNTPPPPRNTNQSATTPTPPAPAPGGKEPPKNKKKAPNAIDEFLKGQDYLTNVWSNVDSPIGHVGLYFSVWIYSIIGEPSGGGSSGNGTNNTGSDQSKPSNEEEDTEEENGESKEGGDQQYIRGYNRSSGSCGKRAFGTHTQ